MGCEGVHTYTLDMVASVLVRGSITIGSGTVVHPYATIHALGGGEIEIGSECIIEEFAQIVHRDKGKMVIGDRNMFEAASRECKRVGSGGKVGLTQGRFLHPTRRRVAFRWLAQRL